MARYALIGIFLGIFGSYLLLRTLLYTRDAAKAANDTLRVAQRTLSHTRKTNITELRAYVSLTLSRVSSINDGQETEVVVELKNIGSTPAKIIKTHLSAFRRPKSFPDNIVFKKPIGRSISMAFPNSSSEIKTKLFINNGTVAGLHNQTQIIQVTALVVYQDVFGVHRRTIAHWKADNMLKGSVVFYPAERGNRAT